MFPFISANAIISSVLSCNYIRDYNWFYYIGLIFSDNVLNIFFIVGAFLMLKKIKKQTIALLLCFILPFIYFSSISCRTFRYSVLVIPFLSIISGFGLGILYKKHKNIWFGILVLVIITASLFFALRFFQDNDSYLENPSSIGYFSYLDQLDNKNDKELWI